MIHFEEGLRVAKNEHSYPYFRRLKILIHILINVCRDLACGDRADHFCILRLGSSDPLGVPLSFRFSLSVPNTCLTLLTRFTQFQSKDQGYKSDQPLNRKTQPYTKTQESILGKVVAIIYAMLVTLGEGSCLFQNSFRFAM